jgi:uridine phosphorylase
MADEAHRVREPGVLTASGLIEARRTAGLPLPSVGESVIFTHESSLLGRRMPWDRRNPAGALSVDVEPAAGIKGIWLARCRGVGGPAAAIAIEELAVAGVRRLVRVDLCGSLDLKAPCGQAVLIEGAIVADGTSRHYTNASVVRPAAVLTETLRQHLAGAGIAFTAGCIWTTDAAYRETRSLIESHRSNGAIAVDLEAAAVLAVSEAVGIEAATVLVAADELFDGWRPPAGTLVRSQLKRLFAVAGAALQA